VFVQQSLQPKLSRMRYMLVFRMLYNVLLFGGLESIYNTE